MNNDYTKLYSHYAIPSTESKSPGTRAGPLLRETNIEFRNVFWCTNHYRTNWRGIKSYQQYGHQAASIWGHEGSRLRTDIGSSAQIEIVA